MVLEPEQAGAGIALRYLEQQADRVAQRRRQALRDYGEEIGRDAGHLRGDDPRQSAGPGHHDLPGAHTAFCPAQELGGRATFDGTLADPVAKIGFGRTIEAPDAEIAADALRLRTFGGVPAGPVERQHWGQIELTRQVIDDAQRRLAVVIEKPAVGAQHAQLQGEPTPMIGTPAAPDLDQILRREAPMSRQLVLGQLGRRCAATPGTAATGGHHPSVFKCERSRSAARSAAEGRV